MSELRVATRYAKSILDLAKELKKVEEIAADFASFSKVCDESRDFELLLKSPIIPSRKKLEVVNEIFKSHLSEMTMNFFDISIRKGRGEVLKPIADQFLVQYNSFKNIRKASFSTAVEVSAEVKKAVTKVVEEMTSANINLETTIDPELIGGFVLKMNDVQYDTSVASKLRLIKKNLV
jgi:F-type H+-transporting ATPase subunit delta